MIQGLQHHDAALVRAADGFHANAADVSGNNVPLNGGTYNADGQSVADALSTATGPLPPAPVALLTLVSPATTAVASGGSGSADHLDHSGQLAAIHIPVEHGHGHDHWAFG